MRSRARRTSSTEMSDRVVATVTSYDRGNLRRPAGVSRAMRGSSVLALAAARKDDWKHGKRQDDESLHGVKYGRIAAAVLCSFLVSILLLAGAAAASSPQVVTKIVTGRNPCGVAPGFGSLWVANDTSGTLVRIDPAEPHHPSHSHRQRHLPGRDRRRRSLGRELPQRHGLSRQPAQQTDPLACAGLALAAALRGRCRQRLALELRTRVDCALRCAERSENSGVQGGRQSVGASPSREASSGSRSAAAPYSAVSTS
jgi:hypothetical protein